MACMFEPGGLIGDFWRSRGGERSLFGCPTGPAEDRVSDAFGTFLGTRRDFAGGQIVWSPPQGPNLLVCLFRDPQRIIPGHGTADHLVFEWTDTRPFSYEQWIVRWSLNAGPPVVPNAQEDVTPGGIGGVFSVPYPGHLPVGGDGKRVGVEFIVEGYDDEARQGWTCPVVFRM